MLVSERRIGADRIVEETEFLFGEGVLRIDGEDAFEQGAGLGILAHPAVLHGEGDTGVGKVAGVAGAAVIESRRVGQPVERLRVFVHGLLEVAARIGFTAFGDQAVGIRDIVLTADDLALSKAAVTVSASAFTGIRAGGDDGQSGGQGHEGDDGAAGSIHGRELHVG